MIFSVTLWCMSSIVLHLTGSYGAIAEKEYYSSVAGLEDLINTEAYLLTHLQSYVESLTSQLEMLKSEIVEIEREHVAASEDNEEYHKSPTNGYLLIKRLHKDWAIYEESIESNVAQKSFLDAIAFSRENLNYPTEIDAIESAVALVRLQDTYQLDVSQVASGILNGVKYGSEMSSDDCFQLGEQLFKLGYSKHAIRWFKETLDRLDAAKYTNKTELIDFLDLVSYYHQEMGDYKNALNLMNRVIEIDPTLMEFIYHKEYLEEMVALGYGPYHEQVYENRIRTYRDSNEFKLYEKVCRGEIKQTPSKENPLRCSYFQSDVPYRLLMPYKIEQQNLDPIVVVFHDVLSDNEIGIIKNLAKSNMSRTEVELEENIFISKIRISQTAWLKYNKHPVLSELRRKLADISGLDKRSYEDVMVANYGIGGQYEPHFDFFEGDLHLINRKGNRMATAIFYLSDVEQGGATVFPFLSKAVQPKKGSLLFWYNLHPSLMFDYRTKHAACPVLKGSKWIANIWIGAHEQEFHRPCGLEQDHEISLPYQYKGN